jgi:hypothetical protein
VGLEQHVRVRMPDGRLEAIRRQLDQQPQRVAEIDGVHESAVLDSAVLDAPLVETFDRLAEHRVGEVERDVVDVAGVLGAGSCVGHSTLVREDRDQPTVARVEVQVAFLGPVEVGLLEDERHPEHAFPEVDRGLAVGAGERDVVHALGLDLAHVGQRPFGSRADDARAA